MLRHDKNDMSADGGQVLFTGLPRVAALARNDRGASQCVACGLRSYRNLRVPLGFVSQTHCHCEPRMWRGNPVSKSCASAHQIYQNCAHGRSFVSRILWFFFIGYRRGTRRPSQQPIGHQLCTVYHQILCLPDSFLQRDWLPNHLLSPVQPPQ